MGIQDTRKRCRPGVGGSPLSCRKRSKLVSRNGFLYLRSLGSPMIVPGVDFIRNSICLRSDQLFTFGRKDSSCQIVVRDSLVSKKHCQIFFDSLDRKIYLVDGFVSGCDLDETRRWFRDRLDRNGSAEGFSVRPSLNGVFVNGVRIKRGGAMELFVGDEVSFGCGDRLGFVVERADFMEEIADAANVFGLKTDRIGKDVSLCRTGHEEVIFRASFLLNKCRGILQSLDPIFYIRKCVESDEKRESALCGDGLPVIRQKEHFQNSMLCKITDSSSVHRATNGLCRLNVVNRSGNVFETDSSMLSKRVMASLKHSRLILESNIQQKIQQVCISGEPLVEVNASRDNKKKEITGSVDCQLHSVNNQLQNNDDSRCMKNKEVRYSSPGKSFFLNRLQFMECGPYDQHGVVSLPELFHPVESLLRVFIATFTSDVLWFLSCCEVPNLLQMTIACHDTERCWNSSHDKRTMAPYPDYPNLVLVYPTFPEIIAFGKDQLKKGVACHHPKLLVLQREDSIRVIVTSANLVPNQWNNVTNTVWWQDFPRSTTPDYFSLFAPISGGETSEDLKSDFAAQLAGFMASLLADAPNQAHWILELAKYDFGGAVGHLVSSVPGMHMLNPPYPPELRHFLSFKESTSHRSTGLKFLGSVQASVVGLSRRFRTAADSNGVQLKTLATFLRQCRRNTYGMAEVILKRNSNIVADANAVSVHVCDLNEFSEGDYIQLGFLPRIVAKWVAPLCDAGFFSFSACIYPKEALAAALGTSSTKVQLILYVSQGPNFSEISSLIQPEHSPAMCSLLGSIQRCLGLWRLQEVLCPYKWPESQEVDFIYGASSIGTSLNAKFLAAFSAAAGKKSYQYSESEESDPEWGRWNASNELRSPSIKVIFPSIKTVNSIGIWPYRRLLSLSEKTWQRLKTSGIFHDAIPHPRERVGYPMHVKVAQRRFQSNGSASFGWVYCGSHNLSPAAWGQPIPPSNNNEGGTKLTSTVGSRLYICNYELGIILIVPPSDATSQAAGEKKQDLDDIVLPFVVPPPKYGYDSRPATAHAMCEALAKVVQLEKQKPVAIRETEELTDEMEVPNDEGMVDACDYSVKESEDEMVYAETLWSQVDSSEN